MKKIYIVLFSSLFIWSCNKFDDEINTNPNRPSEASGTQLIASAQLSLPGLSSSPKGAFMAQYLAETQYVGQSLYPQESTSFYSWYQSPLINLQTVIDSEELNGNDGPVANQKAVAKILKAYYFWNITDRWGDVPYFDALQGGDNYTPVYDPQEEIYYDLFEELKEARGMIVSGSINNDIVYNGDMEKWQKFANTVRMLMALRLSEVDPEKGSTEFNEAVNDGVFESNSDNLVYRHLADADNQNYWFGQVVNQNREWWALSETLVEEMKPVDDPRLVVYGDPARSSGEYVGLEFGKEEVTGTETEEFSLLGSDIYAQDAPVYLVTYGQVLFAMAEAVERDWITGDAEDYYNMAIEASMEQWTGSSEGVEDFLSNPEVAFDANNAIESIANQRWVHLYMFGYEAWSEWRRTGYPNDLVEPNGMAVPTRLSYPDNEAFNNEENYNDAIERQFGGDDSIYGNVWWDE
ncbi:SusD/RagB family nutrient-binding outer membrane lipoprotein [Salegentibacter salegens]|uniref:Starch-binding associating with outer membrane n=1 Tax=Salegentibacter salegens TaxID=143223 RepID=A0A1M7I2V8_9FLAO|nr:SusD/RagB family nutrient-binding outer membrane lipoprotein [Salegentibacter salegens]PRX42868.1 SusD-like starch-binding protein associating with outer membrane [Salegentibacter salegens]SHM35126.1 Starch-binding associating with outer membrane [Salegentibacter salegens]